MAQRGTRAAVLAISLLLAGCATPVQRVFEEAADFGFQPLELEGGGFRLTAFFKPAPTTAKADDLHVYLEGDGTPWQSRWQVADDPTPRRPVMLRLMALDEAPALYLGRPCYHGHAADAGCSPALWTDRRYAPEIVDSLAAGLRGFLRRHGFRRLALFGHSGGGALALLLAPRFPDTFAVATLAGNVDTAAWTAHHRYGPLRGSLNPASVRRGNTAEYHYLGAEDRIVPPEVFKPLAERRSPTEVAVVPGFDHGCCWQDIWAAILKRLDGLRQAAAPSARRRLDP
jgi:pimeloyl-ACP methyl ester carboxylesterase